MRGYGIALLGAALIAGCGSGGTDSNNPGTIALGLNPITGTVPQGGQTTVQATLTRGGGFTGSVNLSVTGAPAGVTTAVSDIVTSGATSTATVTINVAASTVISFYQLVVHATASGSTEAIASYALTVTPFPAVSLTLSAPALTAIQGSATAATTVTLTRTNFPGDVTLSVDNLPTGVSAAFAPANPQSGTSSVLTLTIAPGAPVGAFTNLAVRAAGIGITAATAPLSLTINAAAVELPAFASGRSGHDVTGRQVKHQSLR